MINIQKHIISEAFEQLSKSAKLKESKLTERYSFPEVDDALNHFWNDLGKDPEVDDVIGFLEDEYPDWVPTNPEDYGKWYHDVAGEISARLSESKLTEATIPGYKFDKDDIDMKIKAKDPELHIRIKDAAKLAQYLDSKGIPYKIRNIQDPVTK